MTTGRFQRTRCGRAWPPSAEKRATAGSRPETAACLSRAFCGGCGRDVRGAIFRQGSGSETASSSDFGAFAGLDRYSTGQPRPARTGNRHSARSGNRDCPAIKSWCLNAGIRSAPRRSIEPDAKKGRPKPPRVCLLSALTAAVARTR